MAFRGWLIRCGGTEIPMEYVNEKKYSVTPNQRLDLSAERDMTGVLHRDTVAHMPVKIEFETLTLDNSDVDRLNSIIRAAYTDERSRSLTIDYYDPEENAYKSAACYMPDTQYNMNRIDRERNAIVYEPLRYAFIEY